MGVAGYMVPLSAGNPAAVILASSSDLHRHNLAVVSALEHYQESSASERNQGLRGLLVAVEARKKAMLELMRENPKQALLYRLPTDLVKGMPAEVQENIEQSREIKGKWSTIHVDYPDRDLKKLEHGKFIYELQSGTITYNVHFAEAQPEILSGATVTAKGVALDNELVLANGTSEGGFTVTSEGTVLAMADEDVGGHDDRVLGATLKRTLVLAFIFQNSTNSNPVSITDIYKNVFTDARSANSFYQENSAGIVGLTGDIYGWFTIPVSTNGSCNYSDWQTKAKNAASAAGYTLSNYQNFVYIFDGLNTGCAWAGLGLVGNNPTWSMLKGAQMGSSAYIEGVLNHELGHNFGVYHSSSVTCGTSQIAAASSCTFEEYGDPSDVMGAWAYSAVLNKYVALQFNAPNKITMGWGITGSQVQTVTSSGTYTIAPLEASGGTLKVLKIAKATGIGPGSTPYYYISYRQPIGFDALFKEAKLSSGKLLLPAVEGASIHTAATRNTYLIDANPTTASDKTDSFLYDGGTFVDPITGLTVTQLSHNANGVTVSVKFGAISGCVRSAPSVRTSSPYFSGTIVPTAGVGYNVLVTNNNLNCGSATYNMSAALPSEWNLKSMSTTTMTLAQGASAQVTYIVNATSALPLGVAQFDFMAADKSDLAYKGSSSGYYTYYSTATDTTPPTVTLSEPGSGTVSGTVSISVTATDETKLSKVEIYRNGTFMAQLSSFPLTTAWNTLSFPNGTYTLYAKAYDAAGNTATSDTATVNVNNTADSIPPTVSLTAPANGTTVKGTVTVTASASDNAGALSRVEFYKDGVLFGSDTSSPYGFSWVTTSDTNATHSLYAKAYDPSGNSATSGTITITVSNSSDITAPSVPTGLSATPVSSSQISLSWTASTDTGGSGLAGYKVYQGSAISNLPGTGTNVTMGGLLANTNYTFTVAAFDAAGNTSAQSSPVSATTQTVVVSDTTAPSVSISPNGGIAAGTVTLSISATDNSGTVSRVEVYKDGALVGSNTGSSYSYSWDTAQDASGAHTINAKAYDPSNNTGSASAAFSVDNTPDTTPPTIKITSPATGATIKGSLKISTSANDNKSVKQIQVFLDGELKSTCIGVTSCPTSVSARNLAAGPHTISATATDMAELTATDSITVTK
jgi:hypothetical protein